MIVRWGSLRHWHWLVWRLFGWWPRLAARLVGRSYTLSDSPKRRVAGQPLLHWLRYGRVGASHFLLAADPEWRPVLRNHGRADLAAQEARIAQKVAGPVAEVRVAVIDEQLAASARWTDGTTHAVCAALGRRSEDDISRALSEWFEARAS